MAVPALELRPRGPVALFDAAIRVCARSTGVWALTLPGGALVTWAVLWTVGAIEQRAPLALPALALTAAWLTRCVFQGAACHHVEAQILGEAPATVRESLRAAVSRLPSLAIAAAYVPLFVAASLTASAGLAFFALSSHLVVYAATMKGEGHPLALYPTCSRLLGAARGNATMVRILFLLSAALVGLNLHVGTNVAVWLARKLVGFELTYAQRFASLDNGAWVAAVVALTFALFEPLRAAVAALLLIDGRVRQEGLDLLAAVEQLEKRGQASFSARAVALAIGCAIGLAPFAASAQATPRVRIERAAEACEYEGGDALEVLRRTEGLSSAEESALSRLAQDLEDHAAAEDECEEVLWHLDAALPLLSEVVNGSNAEAADPALARERARAILSRPEFAEAPPAPEPEEDETEQSSLQRLWQRFLEWLLRDREQTVRTRSMVGGGMSGAGLTAFVAVALVIVVLAAIGVALWAGRKEGRGGSGEVEVSPVAAGDPLKEGALARLPEGWASLADSLAQEGEFRDAIRSLYLALLSRFHRIGAIDYDPASSNWDYCRQFRGRREWSPAFRDLTRRFDFAWYGRVPLTLEAYVSFRGVAKPLLAPVDEPGPGPAEASRA